MSQTSSTTQSVVVQSLTLGDRFASVITLVERQDHEFTACILEPKGLDLFGVGTSAPEAIEDLRATIVEAYEVLNNERGNLGPKLEAELEILDTFMQPKRAVGNTRKDTTSGMPVRRASNRTLRPLQGLQNASAVAV